VTDLKLFYKRSGDKKDLSLDEIEEISLKYVRNLRLGFAGAIITPDILKYWFKSDRGLTEFPPDVILQRWLDKWTIEYLAQWSFENDHANQSKSN
jgi:hypothetical protein